MICNNQLKKLSNPDYFKILEVLDITEDSMINKNAKNAIRKRTQRTVKPKKESGTKNQSITYRRILRRRKWFRNFEGRQNSARAEGLGVLRRMRKKLLELKYTKGPAAYGSVKNLQKITNLKPSKVKLFLEGKNAHTMNKKYRIKFPTLKGLPTI